MRPAEQVCGGGLPGSVIDGLDRLIGQSLVRLEEDLEGRTRYGMLQTIREYALEQLISSGEAGQIRNAHADHFLHLAEVEEKRLESAQQAAAVRTLEAERENLRAALAWYLEHDAFDPAARVAGALGWFWWLRGDLSEGSSWLERVLALPGASARTRLRGKALYAAGMLAQQRRDFASARPWLKEAIA